MLQVWGRYQRIGRVVHVEWCVGWVGECVCVYTHARATPHISKGSFSEQGLLVWV